MKLNKISNYAGPKGPVVLAIMDGVGIGKHPAGDMVAKATKPHLDWLKQHAVYTQLKAHGTAVGMPSDEDMGNSEVGHNAIGAGRVFSQGASLVENAINNRSLFEGATWKELIAHVVEHGTQLHFVGLLSDGNVHSHIRHLIAMLKEAKAAGVKKVRVHALLDGRDVPPTSALVYLEQLEAVLKELSTDGLIVDDVAGHYEVPLAVVGLVGGIPLAAADPAASDDVRALAGLAPLGVRVHEADELHVHVAVHIEPEVRIVLREDKADAVEVDRASHGLLVGGPRRRIGRARESAAPWIDGQFDLLAGAVLERPAYPLGQGFQFVGYFFKTHGE